MDTKISNSETGRKPNFTDWARARAAFLIDPIVTYLASYHLSPDLLTVLGVVAHIGTAALVATGHMTWAAVTLLIFGPLDALDGALARKLGRQKGGFGAFLDSTLDRIAEIILFGGFLYYYTLQNDLTMIALTYIAITGSLMVSYARGRAEGLGFDCQVGLLGRLERYIILALLLLLNQPKLCLLILASLTYVTVGQRMYHVWKQAD